MSHGLIGRVEELALLEDLLADDPVAPAVFVHGPGGIGKSALLRELTRRAEARGFSVLPIDGRDPAAAQQGAQESVAAAVDDARRSLVIVDAYEHIAALGALLRADLGASVGVRVRLLIAGRRPPEPAWFQGGWEHLLRTVEVGPVPPADAHALLERRGLRDPAVIAEVARWADGSPLALGVAADSVLAGQVPDLSQLDRDGAIAQVLLRRLAGDELEGADREVLAVAAIARAVDARLLAAVLPGVDADRAEAWLRSLSFSEPFGVRVTLHERVRAATRALLATDRDYEHELRRGIADHLYERGVLGELRLLPEIAELIDDPAVRWGASPPHAADHRCGPPAPGDAETIAAALGVSGTEWWAGVRRWFDEAPEHVTIVRDSAGAVAVGGVAVTPASAPAWVSEDPVAGPYLADARSRYPDGDILVLREAMVLPPTEATPDPSRPVAAANTAILLGSGLRRVRAMYTGLSDETPEQREFMRAIGHVYRPELDVADGERVVHCYLSDMGPGGIIGFTRKLVYRDLGHQPPPERPAEDVGADAVRDALRAFHDPRALATSALARGGTGDERAASVRRVLREAVAGAFGDSQDEQLLRSVIEQAYFVPDGGHARAEQDLHMSRTTYYRRLRTAVVRVCDQVLDARVG